MVPIVTISHSVDGIRIWSAGSCAHYANAVSISEALAQATIDKRSARLACPKLLEEVPAELKTIRDQVAEIARMLSPGF